MNMNGSPTRYPRQFRDATGKESQKAYQYAKKKVDERGFDHPALVAKFHSPPPKPNLNFISTNARFASFAFSSIFPAAEDSWSEPSAPPE
jgi:hypothetical protein